MDHSDAYARYAMLTHEPLDIQAALALVEALLIGTGLPAFCGVRWSRLGCKRTRSRNQK